MSTAAKKRTRGGAAIPKGRAKAPPPIIEDTTDVEQLPEAQPEEQTETQVEVQTEQQIEDEPVTEVQTVEVTEQQATEEPTEVSAVSETTEIAVETVENGGGDEPQAVPMEDVEPAPQPQQTEEVKDAPVEETSVEEPPTKKTKTTKPKGRAPAKGGKAAAKKGKAKAKEPVPDDSSTTESMVDTDKAATVAMPAADPTAATEASKPKTRGRPKKTVTIQNGTHPESAAPAPAVGARHSPRVAAKQKSVAKAVQKKEPKKKGSQKGHKKDEEQNGNENNDERKLVDVWARQLTKDKVMEVKGIVLPRAQFNKENILGAAMAYTDGIDRDKRLMLWASGQSDKPFDKFILDIKNHIEHVVGEPVTQVTFARLQRDTIWGGIHSSPDNFRTDEKTILLYIGPPRSLFTSFHQKKNDNYIMKSGTIFVINGTSVKFGMNRCNMKNYTGGLLIACKTGNQTSLLAYKRDNQTGLKDKNQAADPVEVLAA